MVGTRLDVNTFHVSANDLLFVTEFILKLPAFEAAVNESLALGRPLPVTSIIINVLYETDYTGHGPDPNATLPGARVPARNVSLDGFGMTGLFEQAVGGVYAWCPSPHTADSVKHW